MSADPLRERLDEIAPRPEDLSPLATVNQHQEIDCWCFGTHAEGLHGFYERERDRSRMADALRAVLDLCDHTTSYAAGTRIPVLHVESVLYAITEALSVAAGGSATPAEHEHDDYCQEVMCPVPEPSAGRATQGTADERHEPTLGTWSVYSDTSAMFCRCGKRFDNEVHDVQRATQGAAPTPAAVCCPGGVAPHEFGSDDWNDNPEACELCNHREDHPIHQRGADPVALPHVDNGYGDCIGCGIDDETGNSRSSSADCHVQRATQGAAPTPAEHEPHKFVWCNRHYGNLPLCKVCDQMTDHPIHQRDDPQGTQSTTGEVIATATIPANTLQVGDVIPLIKAEPGVENGIYRGYVWPEPPARDLHCGLTHPHTATTKCPGGLHE